MKINYLPLLSILVLTNGCAMKSTNYKYQPPPPTFTEEMIDSPDVIFMTADRPKWAEDDVIYITSDRPAWAKDDANDVDRINYVDSVGEITSGDVGEEKLSRSEAAILGATYGTGEGALYGTATALNICGSAPILCPGAVILIPVFTVTGAIVGGTYGAVTGKSDF
jgi:hypothetical protein